MARGTTISVVLGLVSIACAVGVAGPGVGPGPATPTVTSEPLPAGGEASQIVGVVFDNDWGKARIEDALIVLTCTCLSEEREARADADGVFRFGALPPGEYAVRVLYGRVDESTQLDLAAGQRARVLFPLDPLKAHPPLRT